MTLRVLLIIWLCFQDVFLGKTSLMPQQQLSNLRGTSTNNNTTMEDESKPFFAVIHNILPVIGLPGRVYDNFKHAMTKAMSGSFSPASGLETLGFFDNTAVSLPKSTIAKMPDLTFNLDNGVSLTLTPSKYLQQDGAPGAKEDIMLTTLQVRESNGVWFRFGLPVLNRMYLELDREKRTVGFAAARPGCAHG